MASSDQTAANRIWSLGEVPRRARVFARGAIRQVAIQAMSGVSALVLVRGLSVDAYAQYTIGSSVIALCLVLSDLGLTSSLIGLGGPRCEDRTYLNRLWREVGLVRSRLIAVAMLLVSIYLFYIGSSYGWGLQTRLILAVTVCSVCYLQSRVAIDGAIARVRGRSEHWQITELAGAAGKLVCAATVSAIRSASGALGLLVVGIGYSIQWVLLRRSSESRIEECSPEDDREVRKAVWRYVRPLLFPAFFFAIYGQLSVVILSWLGVSREVASLGALGRIGQILTVPGALVTTYWIPRIARESSRRRAAQLSVLCGLFLVVATTTCMLSGYLLPDIWVALLGSQYSNVGPFLWMAIAISSMTLMDSTLYAMTVSRGYTRKQWLTVPAHLAGLLVAVLITPPEDLRTLLHFDLVRLSIPLALQALLFASIWGEPAPVHS